ncbi:PQQ-dependent sugar dehydrogenase [Geoalkalibacter halelectricus]|uniref:PQQ-dependent sugar dehydrogenase n=1 Tax=Geoalkalibacter halelectricus TaxID=2847045 RepID=UPI0026705FB6|nr:PQQ-dependent sugar dehydrogenase [Geoalkalibacter halelectricus]MDO3376737.1 PQQ-dependent sugar dehydrogenase [Geoalkalibacter halelectricus]
MVLKRLTTSLLLVLTVFLVGFTLFRPPGVGADEIIETQEHQLRVITLVEGLEHPWGLAFLPDGRMLVTERPGRLRLIVDGELKSEPVAGLPEIVAVGQGGLLDIALHPRFADNHLVYFSYAGRGEGGIGTEVARGRLVDNRLEDLEVIFSMEPKSNARQHFGSRLVFDREGFLYITLGDRGEMDRAQVTDDHAGSVIRLHDDGRVPEDNPFVGKPDFKPEIYTYGHRNIQGAALHPESGKLWTHEHGPQGGDEVNIIRAGRNYGWPVITHGVQYVTGARIGVGTEKEGMESPLHYWVPVSIAPSGMAFYTGERFPNWRGDLFIGALRDRMLVRLRLDGERVSEEEHMLEGTLGRIRDVRQGPDGYLYLLTDERRGVLARLEPADP